MKISQQILLEYVRNIVQHSGRHGIDTEIQVNDAGQRNSWRWGNLPNNEQPRRRGAILAAAYNAHLQGQDMLLSLEQISKEIGSIRGRKITRDAIEQPGHSVECDIQFEDMSSDSDPESS